MIKRISVGDISVINYRRPWEHTSYRVECVRSGRQLEHL